MTITKKVSYTGILIAVAVSAAWLERLLPSPLPVPGVKLGLANGVTLVALYALGPGVAWLVALIRVLVTGFLFGGPSAIMYGLAGGTASLAVMILLKKTNRPTAVGVSVAGGVFHNVGQLLAAFVLVDIKLIYYAPVMLATGAAAGAVTGLTAALVLRGLSRFMLSTTKP